MIMLEYRELVCYCLASLETGFCRPIGGPVPVADSLLGPVARSCPSNHQCLRPAPVGSAHSYPFISIHSTRPIPAAKPCLLPFLPQQAPSSSGPPQLPRYQRCSAKALRHSGTLDTPVLGHRQALLLPLPPLLPWQPAKELPRFCAMIASHQ